LPAHPDTGRYLIGGAMSASEARLDNAPHSVGMRAVEVKLSNNSVGGVAEELLDLVWSRTIGSESAALSKIKAALEVENSTGAPNMT